MLLCWMHDINDMSMGSALALNRHNSLTIRSTRQRSCNQWVGCLLCSLVRIQEGDGTQDLRKVRGSPLLLSGRLARSSTSPRNMLYHCAQLKDKILPNQFMPNWIVLWAGSRTRSFCSHVGIVWCEGKQEFRNPRNLSSWNLKSRPHKKLKYEHK